MFDPRATPLACVLDHLKGSIIRVFNQFMNDDDWIFFQPAYDSGGGASILLTSGDTSFNHLELNIEHIYIFQSSVASNDNVLSAK